MNLADYLGDLLRQYDEVTIPGLGFFTKVYKNAFYNEQDARFYPPCHQVKFVAQPKDDDIFAQYVAIKKNISLASSKYFTEKFVNMLKEQALTGKYILADLGFFYQEQKTLAFEAYDKVVNDPAFYGYEPVNIFKLVEEPVRSTTIEPAAIYYHNEPLPEVVEDTPVIAEEAPQRRGANIWVVLLLVLIIIALATFGILSFYPGAITRIKYQYVKMTNGNAIVVHEILKAKPDTIKKMATDNTAKTTVVPVNSSGQISGTIDTSKVLHYEIIAAKYQHPQKADAAINRFKGKRRSRQTGKRYTRAAFKIISRHLP